MANKETDLIIRLRQDVSMLRKDMAKSKAMLKRQSSQFKSIGRDMSKTLATYFSGFAVLQGVSTAVRSLAGFEKEMSKVRAVSSASASQFEDLTQNALELGRTSKFTAQEIATLQVALAKLGFTPEKIIASADAVRKLATVADSELGPAAETMAGTLNSFNLEASESERIANIMAESFSKSALDLEKFTVATANSGAVANALGITLEENTARIAALVDANIDASKAGTDLRKIYSELNKSGLTFNQAMEVIRQSSNQAATAQELFGQRAFGAALILSKQTEKVADLTKELRDSNKELDTMSEIMEDNLTTSFDKLISALDGVIQKGSFFRDILKGITDFATLSINALAGNLPSYGEELVSEFTKAGKQIADGFQDTEEDLSKLNDKVQEYQHLLSVATGRLNAFAKENSENGKVTASNALEFRDLKDETIKYGVILSQLRVKQMDMNTALLEEEEAAKAVKKELKEIQGVISSMKSVATSADIIPNLKAIQQEQEIKPLNPMDIDHASMREGIDQALFDMNVFAHRMRASMDTLSKEITHITNDVIAASIMSIGESIGDGSSLEDAFAKIQGVIAQGMRAIGAAMIAEGAALAAIELGLSTANPAVLIGGGIALIAAAGALSGAISSASSLGRSGSGDSSGGRGGFQNNVDGRSIRIEGEMRFDGRDLVAAYDYNKDLQQRA